MHSLVNLSVQLVLGLSDARHIALHPDHDTLFIGSVNQPTLTVTVLATHLGRLACPSEPPTLVACLPPEISPNARSGPRALPIADTLIVSLKVLLDSDQICLVTSDGRLSLCPIPDFESNSNLASQFEGVGCFEDGILAASWSPDEELLVIITGSHKLVLLTKSFDVLCEHEVDFAQFGSDQPVSLGWGSKSTQFHGSLGKAAAQEGPTDVNQEPTLVSQELDTQSYGITWRGDGAFFAVACPSNKLKNGRKRCVKVYSRMASLSSTSTEIGQLSLHGPIAWRPEGSIIASAVYDQASDQTDIIFFERNGLQRYGFSLKTQDRIKNVWAMAWNSDSTILAIGVEKRCASGLLITYHRSVQLWTRNNYHWYLKYEVQPDLNPQGLMNFVTWHEQRPLRLYIGTESHIEIREFAWEVFSDPTPIPRDSGSVAVVDGYQLLLTPLRYQVVPPPMSSLQLSTISSSTSASNTPRVISHVAFSATFPIFATIFPNGHVTCYQWDLTSAKITRSLSAPNEFANFTFHNPTHNPITYRQLCISGSASSEGSSCIVLYALFTEADHVSTQIRDGLHIQKLDLSRQDNSLSEAFTAHKTADQYTVRPAHSMQWWKLSGSKAAASVLIETDSGAVLQVCTNLVEQHAQYELKTVHHSLPEFCSTFDHLLTSDVDGDASEGAIAPIGLSDTAKLYVGSHMVTADCSSFTCDYNYLIFATFLHQVKFLDIKNLCKTLLNPTSYHLTTQDHRNQLEVDTLLLKDASRAVERGSRIVTSVPSSMQLVLQMPRGNLETIYPRPMVLRRICLDLLTHNRWLEAFLECRKHKIDLNLLADFDRSKFMAGGVQELVNQINDVDHLNLFLSSLKDIDVTEQVYPITKRWKGSTCDTMKGLVSDDKVNAICILVADTISQKPNKLNYLNSILTAFVCKRPADYCAALNLLAEIKVKNVEKIDEAIKYIIFLSDANELYKVALSMYDLSLVVLIAQHSQKDPEEYLPFLQSLRELTPEMRKFEIDDYLGNFRLAIKHLCATEEDNFVKVLKYAERHALYEEALEELASQPDKVMALRDIQGGWLMKSQKYMQAALVYTLAGKTEKALEGYRQAEAWREFFSLLSIGSQSADESRSSDQVVFDMAQRLEKSGRHVESATVLFDYAGDVEGGIGMLCDGRAFSEAIRQAFRHEREDLITQRVQVEIEEYVEDLLEEIEETHQHTQKQVHRLAELKLASEAEPDAFYLTRVDKEAGEVFDGIDVMTEATTVFRTDYSRYTRGAAQSTYSTRSGRTSTFVSQIHHIIYEQRHDDTDLIPGSFSTLGSNSKLRKKEEKKKAAGKKGSIYEEEYLLNQLSKTASEKLPFLQDQVKTVLPCLVQLIRFEQRLAKAARVLQERLDEFRCDLKAKINEVWNVREAGNAMPSPANETLHEGPTMNNKPSLTTMVPRPVVPDQGAWKLAVFD